MRPQSLSEFARIYFEDNGFAQQFLRTLGKTSNGGAEIGECLVVASRIRDKNHQSWYEEWNALAEKCRKMAEKSAESGSEVSAKEAFFRACEYYRQAEFWLRESWEDPRVLKLAEHVRDCFCQAAKRLEHPVEVVQIPFERTHLPGYFFCSDNKKIKRPVIIFPGGYDSFAEEGYFLGGLGAVKRGYHCLCFDGPGQGQVLRRQKLYMRADFENVLKNVIDWIYQREDVDLDRIAVIGRSFAGYLAPRAACREKRIKALVCDPGQLDIFDLIKSQLPEAVYQMLVREDKANVDRYFASAFQANPELRFFFLTRMHCHGISSVFDYFFELKKYTLKDLAREITCHTLVCDNLTDKISSKGSALYDALFCPKTYLLFDAKDGAEGHCQPLAQALFEDKVFDWLAKVL